jgi:hypothetical protein
MIYVLRDLSGASFVAGAAAVGLGVTAIGACGDSGRGADAANPAEWTAVVDTIGDTVRVHTTGGQVWPADARLESEVAIGVLDGTPEYQFGNIRALAAGPDGRIYVLDGHGPVVRMYAADGTYLRDVGREGEGPGEYKQPDSGLAFLSDGRLALRDPGNGRISLYSADGEYLDSWPVAGSMNTSNPMVVTRSGIALTPVIKNLGASVTEWERGMATIPTGRSTPWTCRISVTRTRWFPASRRTARARAAYRSRPACRWRTARSATSWPA